MKRKLGYFFALIFLAGLLWPAGAWAEPKIYGKTAVLIDGFTGEILWGKDAGKYRSPASTVKMLTVLIAMEQAEPNTRVTVGRKAHETYVGQTIGLREGDVLTAEDLVEASLLWSANDAAVALGEHLAGTPELFALFMNHKAWALGAFQSNFTNPNGYSEPEQYSTAYDLALIGRAALQNSFISKTVRSPSADIQWLNKNKTKQVVNVNHLLDMYPWANGIKTGTTNAAGGCLVGSSVKGGRWLITAVLGSSRRYADTVALMNYGFEHFNQIIIEKNRIYGTVAVAKGDREKVTVIPRQSIFFTLPAVDTRELEVKKDLISEIQAPVKKGQVLGTVKVFYHDRLIEETDLLAGEAVKRKMLSW